MTIRVLVIDDSATTRAILEARLSTEPDITVVASASDAADGRAKIKRFDPDVVTLDIEMPGMNGLDFLEKIMTLRPTPVIIVSGSSREGSEVAARALALGAVDCYAKADGSGRTGIGDDGRLAAMVRAAARVRFGAARSAVAAPVKPAVAAGDVSLVAIGSSTGGVEALQTVLAGFPRDCPPTVIVQHVNPLFAKAIATTLDKTCRACVQLAEPDAPLRRGNVYLAPGGERHLSVAGRSGLHARLRPGEPVSGHRPSVDVLFRSVAEFAGKGAVGILLTGMGRDGAEGLLAMRRAGALTIAQDQATCTVFGMPRAAIALGAAEIVSPVDAIAGRFLQREAA